jgi:predicted NBD/HSP70 family sugar kinase
MTSSHNRGAIPSSLRRINERTLVGLLRRLGAASRADLAKAAGMSQPTVGKITNELLELGIFQELDSSPSDPSRDRQPLARVGRPGRLVRLDGNEHRFLAIQLGVSETRLAVLPLAVQGEDQWTFTFATPPAPQGWLRQLRALASEIPADDLWGVLVSVPGIVDEGTGRILFSPNLHWTERVKLPNLVQQIWPVPVLLVQEIRALALGHLAAEPKTENFLLVDFGQGVGGAIIEGGKLISNPLPLNGEFGHTPVRGNERACGCGAVGCLETLVSRSGLLQSYAASQAPGPYSWEHLVVRLRTHGVPPWLVDALEATAVIVAGALNVLGLRRVIITGSLTEFPPTVVEMLTAGIRRGAMWARFGEVICQSAPRRRTAGLVSVGIDRLLVPAASPDRLMHRTAARAEKALRQTAA